MDASRRAVLAGVGAAAFAGCAQAQGLRGRNKPAPVAGPYGPAAEYAAARRGVSLLVMQDGKILFENYPNVGALDKGWELASGTKSFTGIMAALASADGLLDIDEPAALPAASSPSYGMGCRRWTSPRSAWRCSPRYYWRMLFPSPIGGNSQSCGAWSTSTH